MRCAHARPHASCALLAACWHSGALPHGTQSHAQQHTLCAPALPLPPAPVIVESTYGTQLHGPREARERLFADRVANTVLNGGRVLVPIVAIGRAQVRPLQLCVNGCCCVCLTVVVQAAAAR